jgi:N-formylmaleamate deformylase
MTTYLYGGNVHANGIRQHYLRFGGKGDVVILLPGITSPAPTWNFVAERLGKVFDVYTLDARGRGLSDVSPLGDYSLDVYAKDVAEFIKVLNIQHYYVIGHSMGARTAIRLGRHHREGIGKLILVDPPVSGPGRENYPTPLSWYVDSIRLSQAGVRAEELRPYSPTWSDYHLQVRAEWLHTCNEEAVVKTYRGFHEENIQDDLPYVQAPTTLIAAGRGGVIADTDIAEFKRLMPKIDVVRMHNAGHMVPWDDFEGFFAELKKILPAANRGGY